MTRRKLNVEGLGQVFTPDNVVDLMLSLRRRRGRVLEPSCGDGAFSKRIPGCVAIELDRSVAPVGSMVMDFFAYPTSERFSTVIGNPPYVKFQDIGRSTQSLLDGSMFDGRTNLALFFIAKAVEHLKPGGELIFIVPREFIKLTAAKKMNRWLFEHGTITHWIETGDTRLFQGAVPNCAIFRYELGNFSRRTQYRTWQTSWEDREFVEFSGQLAFTRTHLNVPLAALFDVKVGAVSGADDLFLHHDGNFEFVCSKTIDTGETRRMIYNVKHPSLNRHKERLLARQVRHFDQTNWWMWGRAYHDAPGHPRIYVNGRTRRQEPFFTHKCEAYDGSILALFPRVEGMNLELAIKLLNSAVPWADLGFVVDGRFVFSQRTLQTLVLPDEFNALRMPRVVSKTERGQTVRRTRRA